MFQSEFNDDFEGLLLLPKLRIQNANAISSPLTWGFPSPTAFTGFMHALQRRLSQHCDLKFTGIGIVCHHFEAQAYGLGYYGAGQFALTRNPVESRKKIDKDGNTTPMSIVEEGRVHLEVSLLIAIDELPDDSEMPAADLVATIERVVGSMRVAGGSILRIGRGTEIVAVDEFDDERRSTDFRRLRRRLTPGFALVARPDYMAERLLQMQETDETATAFDVVLDAASLTRKPSVTDDFDPLAKPDAKVEWAIERKPGWLVPLPMGYQSISPTYPAGSVKNARDEAAPFQFVESVFGIGQWISPHRIRTPEQLFWYERTDQKNGQYLCANNFAASAETSAASGNA